MGLATLQNIGALAFVLLGVATGVRWARQRTPSTGYLALAIILLSFVSVAGRLFALLHISSMAVTSVTLVAFMGSAYALLRYRDSLIPLSRPWHLAAIAATLGVTAAFIASQALVAAKFVPTSVETATAFVLIGVWAALVLEPIIRFWLVARSLPAVQAWRLRSLSLGFAAIVLILSAGQHVERMKRTRDP